MDLIPVNTANGIVYMSQKDFVQHLNGLGEGFAILSSAAGAGASYFAAAAGTQPIPVVGQILGAVAVIAGFIAKARARAKAAKAQSKEVDKATIELVAANQELDSMTLQSNLQLQQIQNELNKLGLNGIDGFGDWLKKTFTPGKYQEDILNDKVKNYQKLEAQVEAKITNLQNIQNQLQALADKLTRGKTLQRTLLIGGGIALGVTLFYFLNQKYKWVKI